MLAGELHRSDGDFTAAIERYETILEAFVQRKHKNALSVGSTLWPKTQLGIKARDVVIGLIHGPLLARNGRMLVVSHTGTSSVYVVAVGYCWFPAASSSPTFRNTSSRDTWQLLNETIERRAGASHGGRL